MRNIALVGCGGWGRNHLRVLHEIGRLGRVVELDPARRSFAEQQTEGAVVGDDLQAVLDDDSIEGVVIATPAATHASLATRCLEAGKDVLVEKPLALSEREGRELVALGDRLGRVVMVGHVLLHHPVVRRLLDLAHEGELGRLRYVYATRANFGRIRTEESALWSFAPHDVAILDELLRRHPSEVTCQGGAYLNKDVADATMTLLSYPSGVRGHIFVSWLHPMKEHRLVVVGDKKMAVFDDTLPWEEKLMLFAHRVDWADGQVPVANKAEGTAVDVPQGEPLKRELEAFCEAIATREVPVADGASGLRVLEVLQAADRSLRQGGHRLAPGEDADDDVMVHPTALVDDGAVLGPGTRVWHFCHVMPKAQLGARCSLGQNVFVANHVTLGENVKVQNNVSIYEGVTLEDDVFCGPSMVFTNVLNPRSAVNRKNEYRPTLVKRGATIGANATVVCGTTLGEHAFVGAGATVTRDVPAYALVVGTPAKRVGWMCACGARLPEGASPTCAACDRSYQETDGVLAQVGGDRP